MSKKNIFVGTHDCGFGDGPEIRVVFSNVEAADKWEYSSYNRSWSMFELQDNYVEEKLDE